MKRAADDFSIIGRPLLLISQSMKTLPATFPWKDNYCPMWWFEQLAACSI